MDGFQVDHGSTLLLGASARILDFDDSTAKAWAEDVVRKDKHIKWIQGNYVEADRANQNGHIFRLAELLTAQETLLHKPLNMLHHDKYIVGSYAGARLLTPGGDEVTAAMLPQLQAAEATERHPVMEAVAGMWHNRFPDEYKDVRRAHGEGTLFFSMEAQPPTVTCPNVECGVQAAFVGLSSDTYCEHMHGELDPKILDKPIFAGGAIIIPPVKPGWNKADVTAISALIKERYATAEAVYETFHELAPHLEPRQWETAMAMVMEADVQARDFAKKVREKFSKTGVAMPDGSFPIPDKDALDRAIKLAGNAKDPAKAKAHIKKRAKALGATDMIPDTWS